MDFLEKILEILGDAFSGFSRWVENTITGLFGSSNARELKKISPRVNLINALEPKYKAMSDEELRQQTDILKQRLYDGETLDDILDDAFAVCREASRRVTGLRHYDVQLIGGIVLHNGDIAEMMTGEGKTLVATLPAYLNALEGKGVHIVTVNDYLARRDMEWMGPIYMFLGLTVGSIQSNMSTEDRQAAYSCDITYGTNNEFGFDYLRDNMRFARRGDPRFPAESQQSQGRLHYAIVDEVDNILIDEARTPLIIAGPAHDDVSKYKAANKIALQLVKDVDFKVDEKDHTTNLTDEGVRKAEHLAGVESFYTVGNMHWPHLIDNALKAHHLYKRDVNYVIKSGEIVIVDEFTGRLMEGRNWSDGLHQAVEAKEGVTVKEENQTLATITLQNFFKLYDKLAGMTGTAMTEAGEFWKIYRLDVIAIPPNRPVKRISHPDLIYRSEKEKYDAVVDEIERIHKWAKMKKDDPEIAEDEIAEKKKQIAEALKNLDWDLWLGTAPKREFWPGIYHSFAWRGWWDFGSGSLGDMACHTANMPYGACDLKNPTTVVAESSGHDFNSFPAMSKIWFEFPANDWRSATTFTWYDSKVKPEAALLESFGIGSGDVPATNSGSLIVGEKGAVYSPDDYAQRYFVLGKGGAKIEEMKDVEFRAAPSDDKSKNFDTRNQLEWFTAIWENKPELCWSNFPNHAGPLTETILLGNLAVWTAPKAGVRGEKIEWDAVNLKVTNIKDIKTPGVEELVHPKYKNGYEQI